MVRAHVGAQVSEVNINRRVQDFIRKKDHPENQAHNINFELGILNFWDGNRGAEYSVKYEDELSDTLFKITSRIIAEINSFCLELNGKKKQEYFRSVYRLLKVIKAESSAVFERFPVSNKPEEKILKHLSSVHSFEVASIPFSPLFQFNPSYRPKDLKVVFEFLKEKHFIKEEIKWEDFFYSLTNKEYNFTIQFSTSNKNAAVIIEGLKEELFYNLQYSKLEAHKIFSKKSGGIFEAQEISKYLKKRDYSPTSDTQFIEGFFDSLG